VIGLQNKMPWHLPGDLKYFRDVTLGKKVVMGKNTFLSLGKPLPRRENIVLSSTSVNIEGVQLYSDFALLLDALRSSEEEVFIIGGAQVYSLFLPYADRLYITQINASFKGDTFFPVVNFDDWNEIQKVEGILDARNTLPHTFTIYSRK